MGACFSKKATPPPPPPPTHIDVTPDSQQLLKKEIFVIQHRTSGRYPAQDNLQSLDNKQNPNNAEISHSSAGGGGAGATVRAASWTKEEVDAILIQCGRLSRSASAGAENRKRRRRSSGSKRSFDFDLEMSSKNDDEALVVQMHRRREPRALSPSSRSSSRERDPPPQRSGSRERRSGSGGGRRVSISPNRRSESPVPNSNGGGSNRPKMVAVPATDKSNNAGEDVVAGGGGGSGGGVKRIHVKRNVATPAVTLGSRTAASPRSRSPARANFRILIEDHNQELQQSSSRKARHSPYRRNPLAEIENNAAGPDQLGFEKFECLLQKPTREKITESKTAPTVPMGVGNLELCQNERTTRSFRRSRDPIPPSYTSLLLEDIHNFHQKNTMAAAAAATAPPAFSLPACLSKACSIMEAVADLNSTTTTSDRWKNPKDSLPASENEASPFMGFQRALPDYPKNGISPTSVHSVPNTTAVAST